MSVYNYNFDIADSPDSNFLSPSSSTNTSSLFESPNPNLHLLDGTFFKYLPEESTSEQIVALCIKCVEKKTKIKEKTPMTDRPQKTTQVADSSPSPRQFLPAHNSTSLPQSPLVPFTLALPPNIAGQVRQGKSTPNKRILLAVDNGPNTAQQQVILKDEPIPSNPGPSIFDPDNPFPLVIIDDSDTPTGGPNMNSGGNETTLGDLLNRPQQIAAPRFFAPPTFHPRSGQASTFLQKFEVAAGRNGWDSALRLTYLGNYLEGAASKWYQTYINDPSKVTSTWETLKTDFRREFVGEDYLRELQRKLFGRKQRFTEPPREYYYDLLELADEVDPNMPFDAFKLHFENGLHPSMQDHFSLAAGAATDLPSLLKAVTILQGIHARKISNGRGNTTSPSPGSYNNTGTSKKQWDTPSARTLNSPWSSEAHASSSVSPQSVPRPYQNRSQFPRRNFRDSDSSKRFTNSGNQGASRYNGGNTQHSAGTTRRRDDAYVPNTRSRDGRPICQDCNKIGHFTCRSLPSKTSSSDSPDTNNSVLDSPNGGGRLQ
ncbi:hypothetical protein ABEB36_009215 [Hypothenemus hampei]|uniref:Retrotransposon gag domain-containing protein n=1 Tax=Hypothenemus hampei TaxID=57062 RepID=A0ABD1EPH7_HYPHA